MYFLEVAGCKWATMFHAAGFQKLTFQREANIFMWCDDADNHCFGHSSVYRKSSTSWLFRKEWDGREGGALKTQELWVKYIMKVVFFSWDCKSSSHLKQQIVCVCVSSLLFVAMHLSVLKMWGAHAFAIFDWKARLDYEPYGYVKL